MNHSEARLHIGADPHSAPSPELAEHLASCPECSQFHREMVALDDNIRRALELAPLTGADPATAAGAAAQATATLAEAVAPPPATVTPIGSAATARRGRQTNTWRGWALAASVAAVSVLAVWALRPNDTLAHDVVRHVEDESKSWTAKDQVSAADVSDALAQSGLALDMSSDKITYAHNCEFRGHIVPHLVVSTPEGPVTVIVLRYENVKHTMTFHEDGMTGVITPTPHGSLAMLVKGNENIDAIARQVEQSVRWLP